VSEQTAHALAEKVLAAITLRVPKWGGSVTAEARSALAVLEARAAALERIAAQQPKTLAMIKRNGFVFDSIGQEPGNWQHLAFSIYTDLCEVDLIARAALRAGEDAA
jgi:hypothetical protein